jgi:hypothetical protein
MTASDVLAQLRAADVELRIQGEMVLCRPAKAVSAELRQAIIEHKPELQTLLADAATEVLACSACGELDYMPLARGWRRCLSCGHRWGPPGTAVPDVAYTYERCGGLARADVRPPRPLGPVDPCRTHELYAHGGDRTAWWYRRPDEEPLCGLCHPDPSQADPPNERNRARGRTGAPPRQR